MYLSDLKHRDNSLKIKLQRLYALNRGKTIDLSFRKPYLDLLKAFDNPHLQLPPVIHVAGTNGKGSTIATLKSILEAADYKVHAYTSPHLINFNERIYLAGKNIDDKNLEALIDEALEKNSGNEITFFEITTAIAFAAFSRVKADILLLETGMGGRLDCTNIIENPLASIITPIGYDHMEYLGNTVEKIAREKAGIIKTESPVIIAKQIHPEAEKEIERHAAEKNAKIYRYEKNDAPTSNLQGPHQHINTATVLATLDVIKDTFPVSSEAIKSGLQNVIWPGRLQNISGKFSTGHEVWLDGAHNEDAAMQLVEQAILWQRQNNKPLHLIFAMLQGRNPNIFLNILQPHIDALHLVTIPNEPKAWQPADIKDRLDSRFSALPIYIHEDYREAFNHIEKSARILIAGSLYLAGHVLKNEAD